VSIKPNYITNPYTSNTPIFMVVQSMYLFKIYTPLAIFTKFSGILWPIDQIHNRYAGASSVFVVNGTKLTDIG